MMICSNHNFSPSSELLPGLLKKKKKTNPRLYVFKTSLLFTHTLSQCKGVFLGAGKWKLTFFICVQHISRWENSSPSRRKQREIFIFISRIAAFPVFSGGVRVLFTWNLKALGKLSHPQIKSAEEEMLILATL